MVEILIFGRCIIGGFSQSHSRRKEEESDGSSDFANNIHDEQGKSSENECKTVFMVPNASLMKLNGATNKDNGKIDRIISF